MKKAKREERKVPVPEILLALVRQLNRVAFEKEGELQFEESGSKVARLQGYLAGVREYKQTMRVFWTLDGKYDGTAERELPYSDGDGSRHLDVRELREVVAGINDMTESADWAAFKNLWQEAVDAQKDWLFYTREKGRDLHFVKGWYEAMREIDDTIIRLRNELEAAEQETAENLPFGE